MFHHENEKEGSESLQQSGQGLHSDQQKTLPHRRKKDLISADSDQIVQKGKDGHAKMLYPKYYPGRRRRLLQATGSSFSGSDVISVQMLSMMAILQDLRLHAQKVNVPISKISLPNRHSLAALQHVYDGDSLKNFAPIGYQQKLGPLYEVSDLKRRRKQKAVMSSNAG